MLHLHSKIQISTFSRFKVIAFFFIFVAEFVNFTRKNIGTSNAKRRRSLNYFQSFPWQAEGEEVVNKCSTLGGPGSEQLFTLCSVPTRLLSSVM